MQIFGKKKLGMRKMSETQDVDMSRFYKRIFRVFDPYLNLDVYFNLKINIPIIYIYMYTYLLKRIFRVFDPYLNLDMSILI